MTIGLDRATQYRRAFAIEHRRSGILGHPVEPGGDSRDAALIAVRLDNRTAGLIRRLRPSGWGRAKMMRRVDVFFDGLFMDADALREKGFDPIDIRPANVKGMALRLGDRATLVPDPAGRVHGILMALHPPSSIGSMPSPACPPIALKRLSQSSRMGAWYQPCASISPRLYRPVAPIRNMPPGCRRWRGDSGCRKTTSRTSAELAGRATIRSGQLAKCPRCGYGANSIARTEGGFA